MTDKNYHSDLKEATDKFVHLVYDVTKGFPKDELFGLTSQLRRAALSVALNYVEGYARQRKAVLKHFLQISYGSLKESQYLIEFSHERRYISGESYKQLVSLSDRIGAMIWGITSKIK
jgi:four helix bundle protein